MVGRCWVRNPDATSPECFVRGSVVGEPEPGSDDVTVKLENKKEHSVHTSDVFAANPEGFVCSDNTMLIHLSEATLLANIRLRHQAKDIYTLTGSILLVRAMLAPI